MRLARPGLRLGTTDDQLALSDALAEQPAKYRFAFALWAQGYVDRQCEGKLDRSVAGSESDGHLPALPSELVMR